MDKCGVDSCEQPIRYKSAGLCSLHYQRRRKTGDPLGVRTRLADPRERFWAKVDKTGTCWLWTRGTDSKGYGKFQAGSSRAEARSVLAHIYAYEDLIGSVPEGLELDHLCRNPACVRPDHLEPVTHAENVRRGRWGEHNRQKLVQTHCLRGHSLADARVNSRGTRQCRTCHNEAEARRYRRIRGLS